MKVVGELPPAPRLISDEAPEPRWVLEDDSGTRAAKGAQAALDGDDIEIDPNTGEVIPPEVGK